MSVWLDRVASLAFAAFVGIEWQWGGAPGDENEELAWKLRLAWFAISCSTALAVHQAFPASSEANEASIEHATTTAESIAAVVQPLLHSTPSARAVLQPTLAPIESIGLPVRAQSEPQRLPSRGLLRSRLSFSSKRKSHLVATDLDTSLLSADSTEDGEPTSVKTSRSFSFRPRLFGKKKHKLASTSQSMSALVPTAYVVTTVQDACLDQQHTSRQGEEEEIVPHALVVKDRFGFGPEAVPPPPGFVYVNPTPWGYLGHLSIQEQQVLEAMREKPYTCMEHAQGKYKIDDECLLRFLRARKFDLEKADKMFTAHLQWRDKFMPMSLTPNDISQVLGMGVARFGPYSKQGQPVIIIKVGQFDPNAFASVELFTKYCAFFFERGVAKLAAHGNDKAVLFFDMNGWSLRKHATPHSLKLTGELINIIQAQNPERLSKCVLFGTPMLFNGTWKIISKLIDPVVVNKIQFVPESGLHQVLEFVDAEVLPKEYGGRRELPYPIEGYAEMHPIN
ncbi:hypothetical protein BASA81_000835 [Batrachochytrium salamandrivorans]|nr:hypothetical protein BASA81_000835 [Batrachochytrium salamandrivorans]